MPRRGAPYGDSDTLALGSTHRCAMRIKDCLRWPKSQCFGVGTAVLLSGIGAPSTAMGAGVHTNRQQRTVSASAITAAPGSLAEIQGVSRQIWIATRSDGISGTGTLGDPFNGSDGGFDGKMGELSAQGVTNIQINLLPGIFETQGTLRWMPRSGWRIHGAGIDITTVRLVNVSNNVFGVIAQPIPESNTEISDLTVDCNYSPNNPNFASAVVLSGDRHTLRRIKAINAYGEPPAAENFILAIVTSAWESGSEGNLIEHCEVSQFKGSYCMAISFGSGPNPAAYIGGIIRGNNVYDLHGAAGPSACTAYGTGAMRNAVLEDNGSYNCDSALNNDTGRSINVIIRGNRFIGCRNRGITLAGDKLENYIIEDNLIEVDPTRADWGIVCSEAGGVDRLKNFKIRNNILRAARGLSGRGGGLGIFAVDGRGFLITGNRIESGLKSAFRAPGALCFDNTDFDGNPILMRPEAVGSQINLPRSLDGGTLLLNRATAYVVVTGSGDAQANGAELVAAYAHAKTMSPHGQTRSATNRVTVMLLPGKYALADSVLVLDTPYVDLAGTGPAGSARLESDGSTLVQVTDDVILANLAVHSSGIAVIAYGPQAKAAYFPASNLQRTVIRDCSFSGGDDGLAMRLGIVYAGRYENCRCDVRGWGGLGDFTGIAIGCTGGDFSFGAEGLFAGFATNCSGGLGSFGGNGRSGGGFQGVAKNCTAGDSSFGGSGLIVGCEINGRISPGIPTTGRISDSRIGPSTADHPAVVLGNGAAIFNSTLLANPNGAGFSIDAVGPARVRIAHCRLNHGMRNIINEVAQPLNVEDPLVE